MEEDEHPESSEVLFLKVKTKGADPVPAALTVPLQVPLYALGTHQAASSPA